MHTISFEIQLDSRNDKVRRIENHKFNTFRRQNALANKKTHKPREIQKVILKRMKKHNNPELPNVFILL